MNDSAISGGQAHPIDLYVGERLKQRRKKLSLSQTALGKLVGVSFQQIQKYERGLNRIPASKLYEFSEVMNVPVAHFYEGVNVDEAELDITLPGKRLVFRRTRPLNVLVIDGDANDCARTLKAIEHSECECVVHTEHDGIKALSFLRNSKRKVPFLRPDIIILELRTAKMGGHAVLKEIKRDRQLKDVPIIMLTNSIDPADMLTSYKSYASGYIYKAVDEEEFHRNIGRVISYWGKAVILPSMQE